MFKVAITIRTADDARMSIEKLCVSLEESGLPSESKSFLIDAARETLELWRTQLTRPDTKSLKGERVFEGSDYRVVLRVRSKSAGIVGHFRRIFGIS